MSATDYDPFIAPKVGHLQEAAAQTRRAGGKGEESDFSFGDLLDIFNPLHHIPIVGNIYRELTGDEINGTARIVGGGLFGGPMGMISAAFNQIFEDATGRDMAETALAVATGQEIGGRSDSDLAAAEPQQTLQDAPAETVATATSDVTDALAAGATASEPRTAQAGVQSAISASQVGAGSATAVDKAPVDADLLVGQAALSALAADLRATARPAAEPQGRRPDAAAPPAAVQQLSSRPSAPPNSFMPVSARDFAGPRPQTSPLSATTPSSPPAAVDDTPERAVAEAATARSPIAPSPIAPGAGTSVSGAPAPGNPLLMPAATSDTDFANRMMEALIKYEALSKEQAKATGQPATRG